MTGRRFVFLGHATPQDNSFTLWLGSRLTAAGYEVWCDLKRLVGGETFWNDITTALSDNSAIYLPIVSNTSVDTATRSSGFSLRHVFYTVPSTLIGHRLRIRLHDDRLECFLGTTLVLTLPRGRAPGGGRGRRAHVVDYRHIIHSLRRKPGALLNLTYRDALFPRTAYRRTWDALLAVLPAQAASRCMVGLLALAHDRACEAELAQVLDELLEAGDLPDLARLQARFTPAPETPPAIDVLLPEIASYDALLELDTAA